MRAPAPRPGSHNAHYRAFERSTCKRTPVRRNQVALAVVAVLALRTQDAEAVTDRDARSYDEKPLREPGIARRMDLVHGLPSDQHRHHDGLAGTGRHF